MAKKKTGAYPDAPSAEEFIQALHQVGIDPRDVHSAVWEAAFAPVGGHPLEASGWLLETETGWYRIRHEFCPFLDGDLPWVLSRA